MLSDVRIFMKLNKAGNLYALFFHVSISFNERQTYVKLYGSLL